MPVFALQNGPVIKISTVSIFIDNLMFLATSFLRSFTQMVLKIEASLSLFSNLKVVFLFPPSHHCLNCASHSFSQHSIFCVQASFGWMYSFHPWSLLAMVCLHNMEEDQQTHAVLFSSASSSLLTSSLLLVFCV